MNRPLKQDYTFAKDDNDCLINVKDAQRYIRYTCPCCGEVMIPHMGKKNRWHFKHKSGSMCNYETYLHKIAKIRIRESFLSSEKFEIIYDAPHECNANCPIGKSTKCRSEVSKSFNLRDYYDSCEEELTIGNFKADLLLTSIRYPNDPILIEIYVSHKCTQEKLNSGFRIIEINIKTEDDISKIAEHHCICGSINMHYNSLDVQNIVFHNFNKVYYTTPNYDSVRDTKFILWVSDKGEFGVARTWCFDYPKNIPQSAVVIISDAEINWLWAFSFLQEHNIVNVVNCLRCKFFKRTTYGDKICTLYKKFSTPKSPNIKYAVNCSYYRISNHEEYGISKSDFLPENYNRTPTFFKVVKGNEIIFKSDD